MHTEKHSKHHLKARPTHRSRARLPRQQFSHRLKRLEDRVVAVEKHVSPPESQGAPQIIVYVQDVPRSPSSSQPLPWAHLWPDLADFYYNNIPDYSGHDLYTVESRHNQEYAALALQEPATFTAQVLIAETARVENHISAERLFWLKATALSLVNDALRDSDRAISAGTLGAVAAMTVNAIIGEDSVASKAHMRGLKQILQIRGGLPSMKDYGFIRNLVTYVDSLHTYFEGGNRHIVGWDVPSRPLHTAVFAADPISINSANAGMFPLLTDVASHPLRLAVQPLYSNLSTSRLRNHLLLSLGSAMTALLHYLGAIDALAEVSLLPPYRKSPQQARSAAGSIEYYLLACNARMRLLQLSHPMYSEADQLNHKVVHDCVIRVALLLTTALLSVLDNTAVAKKRLDHNIQALYALDLQSALWRHSHIVLWALFLATSLDTEGGLARDSAVKTMSQICRDLDIASGADLRGFLGQIFYCSALQDKASSKLWYEMEPLIKNFTPTVQEVKDLP